MKKKGEDKENEGAGEEGERQGPASAHKTVVAVNARSVRVTEGVPINNTHTLSLIETYNFTTLLFMRIY